MKRLKLIITILVVGISVLFLSKLIVYEVKVLDVWSDLKKIKRDKKYSLEGKGWKIDLYSNDKTLKYVNLSKKKGDTVISFNYFYYKDLDIYQVDYYGINYSDDTYNYQLRMDEDTLYHFKTLPNKPEEKIFLQGEYFYKYKNNLLDSLQKAYFLEHKDSLMKLKGNNLPELPRE